MSATAPFEVPVAGTAAAVSPAVRGVDLSQKRGETFGLVGESGSGKSVMSSARRGCAAVKPSPVAVVAVLAGQREEE